MPYDVGGAALLDSVSPMCIQIIVIAVVLLLLGLLVWNVLKTYKMGSEGYESAFGKKPPVFARG
jgi:hypothetical protein